MSGEVNIKIFSEKFQTNFADQSGTEFLTRSPVSLDDRLSNTSNFAVAKAKKRHLLSLNGLKLTKHLQTTKNEHTNSRRNISTDLSMWVGND